MAYHESQKKYYTLSVHLYLWPLRSKWTNLHKTPMEIVAQGAAALPNMTELYEISFKLLLKEKFIGTNFS